MKKEGGGEWPGVKIVLCQNVSNGLSYHLASSSLADWGVGSQLDSSLFVSI